MNEKKSGQGAETMQKSKWPFFESMKFLDINVVSTQTSSSLDMSLEFDLESNIDEEFNQRNDIESSSQSNVTANPVIQSSSGSNVTANPRIHSSSAQFEKHSTSSRKRKLESATMSKSIEEGLMVAITQNLQNNNSKEDCFGAYLAQELKELDPALKEEIKTKIQMMLHSAKKYKMVPDNFSEFLM